MLNKKLFGSAFFTFQHRENIVARFHPTFNYQFHEIVFQPDQSKTKLAIDVSIKHRFILCPSDLLSSGWNQYYIVVKTPTGCPSQVHPPTLVLGRKQYTRWPCSICIAVTGVGLTQFSRRPFYINRCHVLRIVS